MVYLAFFKGKASFFGRLIRWWTRSPYSHVELAFPFESPLFRHPPGERWFIVYSSDEKDGGSRAKVIDLRSRDWDLVPVPVPDEAKVLQWCHANLGRRYDFLGIFGMVISPARDNPNRFFCSEFCLRAAQEGGWGHGTLPAKTSPGALFILVTERDPQPPECRNFEI
tara:strand:- start:693 stop:1193 length:501 start_codon:yes stop_codon:yes gene_type:complete